MQELPACARLTILPLPQALAPGLLHTPEQRSFRERQKYFEVELKQRPVEKPPKRVSLVGEEDLRKMKEEEGECPASGLGLLSLRTGKAAETPPALGLGLLEGWLPACLGPHSSGWAVPPCLGRPG